MTFAILIALAGIVTEARADPPMVGYLFPAGGQRGTRVTGRIGGCNLYASPKLFWTGEGISGPSTLDRIETVWMEGPLIPQPASQQREDYPRDYGTPLVIAPTAALGRHSFRLATSQGVTTGWGFVVGDFPEVVEVEAEGNTTAVEVALPVTINGRIFPREDVDTWKFTATAGQVVTCRVATSEFGSPLDARIVVVDAGGRMLAESLPAGEVTPPLRLTIPSTGEYQIKIHDISYSGLQNHVYRLTMTSGPVLDAVYPLGGRRGSTTRFELDGANLGEPNDVCAACDRCATPHCCVCLTRKSRLEMCGWNLMISRSGLKRPQSIRWWAQPTIHKSQPFTVPGVLNGTDCVCGRGRSSGRSMRSPVRNTISTFVPLGVDRHSMLSFALCDPTGKTDSRGG